MTKRLKTEPVKWTNDQIDYLMANYANKGNKQLAQELGLPVKAVQDKGNKFGLMKTRFCKAKIAKATEWTPDMIRFLTENIAAMSNKKLAQALSLKLTVVRNKIYELGLQRMELEPWTPEQVTFLLDNFRKLGDVELADKLQELYPRKKGWSKHHIAKKRTYLKLKRSEEDVADIVERHHGPGGRMNTIDRNSCSVNLTDRYVASTIAHRDAELKQAILDNPDLIELKRSQIKLNRAIKAATNK